MVDVDDTPTRQYLDAIEAAGKARQALASVEPGTPEFDALWAALQSANEKAARAPKSITREFPWPAGGGTG